MDTTFDILQAIGLGLAFGLRPILAPLVVAICAAVNLGVDFEGTPFDFLENPIVIGILGVIAVVGLVDSARAVKKNSFLTDAVRLPLALVFGGLFGAGSVAEHSDTWVIGAVVGVAAAALGWFATASLVAGARKRLEGEAEASLILAAVVELIAIVTAFLSLIFPPLAIIALVAVLVLLVRGRKTSDGRYAGLRTLSK